MAIKDLIAAQKPEGKAIPAHPMLMDGPLHVGISPSGRTLTPLSQREASRHLQAYGGAESIDWLMDCIRLVAETAANAEWHFEDEGERLLTRKHPLAPQDMELAPEMLRRLFAEPNPHMTYEEMIELTIIDYLAVGNAYWVKWGMNEGGQPLALYRMAPQHVKIIPGRFGAEAYEYQLPGAREATRFPAASVMHFKAPNPHNPYYGLGIIQGGARVFDMELALIDTIAGYFENQALPSGVVQSDRIIPKHVFAKLKQQLRAFYGGSSNAGRLMVLEAGLKYQTISPTAAEAMFKELTEMSRDRILAMFRVHPSMLGIDAGAGEGKINEAQRLFDTKTMRPLLNKLQVAITRGIVNPGWGLDFVIDYEYVMPPEERLKLAGNVAALPGIRVREIREAAGYEPLGDPELDDLVLNLPAEDGEEGDTRNGAPDRNLPGEPGRPPLPENTLTFNGDSALAARAGGAQARKSRPRRPSEKGGPDSMSLTDALARIDALALRARAREGKAKQPSSGAVKLEDEPSPGPVVRPDDVLLDRREREVDAIAADLRTELLDAVHYLERDLLDRLEGKAVGSTVYQRIKNSTGWKDFRERISGSMERAVIRALAAARIHQGTQGRDVEGEIDYEGIAREIVYGGHSVTDMTATLQKDLLAQVLKLQQKGADRSEIEGVVRNAIDSWRNSKAETIALDAATDGYNEGTLVVAELTGSTHVFVFDGDEHDEPCAEANGQTWTIEQARENPREHPRCRRAFTPISVNG